jgi:SAM-dependent methyltransferase
MSMMMTRPASLLSLALLIAVGCGHQERPQSAQQSTPSPAVAPVEPAEPAGTELTPAAGSLPANDNALGVPDTPPAASEGPAGASPGTAEPARTPDVVYVPTPQPVVDRMLQMAKVKKSDVVYDLGCGDGRIVVTAAKRYGARAYGFDIDPDRVAEARANVAAAKVEHLVTIEQRDIFTLDLSPASVVTLYLLPALNVKLIPQLQKLKPGSRIVSHDFAMEGVKPLQHVTIPAQGDSAEHAIYLWHAPITRQ